MEFDAGIPMSRAAAAVAGSVTEGASLNEDAMWKMNMISSETMDSGQYPERPGEPDCSYYIRTGLCRFGATCRFNHPPNRKLAIATARMKGEFPERVGQPECQYYLKTGTCKFGATCKFHHPRDKAGVAGRVALNILGYPLRPEAPRVGGILHMWDKTVVGKLNTCVGGFTVACAFWIIGDKLEWAFARFMVPTLIVEKLYLG